MYKRQVVDVGNGLLVEQGSVEPAFAQSIKDTVKEFGSYMVMVDDLAFFHGRPEAGVKKISTVSYTHLERNGVGLDREWMRMGQMGRIWYRKVSNFASHNDSEFAVPYRYWTGSMRKIRLKRPK